MAFSLKKQRSVLALLSLFFVLIEGGLPAFAMDWSQPPVGCIEEVIFRAPSFPCLDLSPVKDPIRDLPPSLTPEEVDLWTRMRKRELLYCRAEEVLRRERIHPGSQNEGALEVAWMRTQGTLDTAEKVKTIYQASDIYGVPPHVLLGAFTQESMLADLGIASDGGNYSCGIGQLNVLEWCRWVENQSSAVQNELSWPTSAVARFRKAYPKASLCSPPFLNATFLEPYHKIALTRLKGLPAYRLSSEHFLEIPLSRVIESLPKAQLWEQELRHALITGFHQNCTRFRYSIPAKAHELETIFKQDLPSALQNAQHYRDGQSFARTCQAPSTSRAYPLHVGWLMADAIYNAGVRIRSVVSFYRRLTPQSAEEPQTWESFSPQDLVTSLYWGGKFNPKTNLIEATGTDGGKVSLSWYKSCVVQRHIARVTQYVTLPGVDLVQSLEGAAGCSPKQPPPAVRQSSSGQISSP